MSPEMIGRTIQLILGPVVMISACSVFVGGVLNHYTSVGDRIRALTRERLDVLGARQSTLGLERLEEIDAQLPELLMRHRLIHDALISIYASIGVLILTMCTIAVTASIAADWVGSAVYAVFVLSVLAMLIGVVLITMEIGTSRRSLVFEVDRVRRLPVNVTTTLPEETVHA
jgi:hypothetical protein